ncbi:MAG: glycosyltransferase, partial [Candidatus Omnitrophica bacterium]|nr:glycosyltransferase [Candidatus Omnitrophota bacterium]
MAKISVILNTFNEEKLLKRCLKNLIELDEIVIIDMYSKDKTIDVAKKYTSNIYFHPRTISVLYARNFSLTKA